MDISDFFKNCKLFTAEQSTSEMFDPKTSAVYAFYDRLNFSKERFSNDIDIHKTKHARYLNVFSEKWPLELNLKFRGNPERFKGEAKKLLSQYDQISLANICEKIQFLSIVNEPLYIGKTNDIKTRFLAHHDNGFLYKMKKYENRPPSEFLFFVFFCEESEVRLIESILIQIFNPPHCEQKS